MRYLYNIEYCTPGSLTRCNSGNDLRSMLNRIMAEGCRITPGDINGALLWSETAQDGKKHFIGCVCTIIKGTPRMTEYTSF